MICETPAGAVWLAVVSARRPANVERMTAAVGSEATWYVPGQELGAYRLAGAKAVNDRGGLSAGRNAALQDAHEQNLPCVQLDDDLERVERLGPDGKAQPVDTLSALGEMLQRLRASDFRLAGAASTNNAFFVQRATSTHLLVLASMMVALPGHLRFDERFRLKEDYDYTLQHITEHGGVVRCDDILPSFKHYTNAGGAVSVRNAGEEQVAIRLLRAKWGDLVRPHPRRENEVLLSYPRRNRTVLS